MDRAARLARHRRLSARLAGLGDAALAAWLEQAGSGRAGIGGTTTTLELDGAPVFVKQVALTDRERRSVGSTANLFELPMFCQYGVGSVGFGAWRELAVHTRTSGWVLADEHPGFPLLHHARVLPGPPPRPSAPTDPAELDEVVAGWDGSPAVRARLTELACASARLVLLMEHHPHTVHDWLGAQVAAGAAAGAVACAQVERQLGEGVAFLRSRGMVHFDAHFDNLLTDGQELFFADFGLALCEDFELTRPERAFLHAHAAYDAHYTRTHLARWLLTALLGGTPAQRDELLRRSAEGDALPELPAYAAALVARQAPVATILSDFLLALQTGSKRTPYPDALRA